MSKPFDELRKKMSPESQKRAAAKTAEMLETISDTAPAKPIAYLYELEPRDGGHCEARRWDITRRGDYIREGWVETPLYAAPSPATHEAEGSEITAAVEMVADRRIGGKMTLAELLKSRRETYGLSLQDVAYACGVSKAHIWDMEQGNSFNPSLTLAIKLSLCLGLTVNALAAASIKSCE